MNLTIDLNGVDPVIAEVKKIAAPESLAKANERMGEGVKSWLSSWYRNKAESGHFENTSLPTHGPGRKKTGWANDIARNCRHDGGRCPHLPHRAGRGGKRGGTSRPCTIPVVENLRRHGDGQAGPGADHSRHSGGARRSRWRLRLYDGPQTFHSS